MELVFGLDHQVSEYIAHHFPIVIERGGYDPDLAIGLMNKKQTLIGGVVLTDYQDHDVELTIYLEPGTHLTRSLLRKFFSTLFFILKLKRITAKIASKNITSRKFVERLGFKQEGILRNAFYNGDDIYLYGMLKTECPWIVIHNKKKEFLHENAKSS